MKFYFQVQLQMMSARKEKTLFCVASPNSENDKFVNIVPVDYKEDEILEIVNLTKTFWEKSIFLS